MLGNGKSVTKTNQSQYLTSSHTLTKCHFEPGIPSKNKYLIAMISNYHCVDLISCGTPVRPLSCNLSIQLAKSPLSRTDGCTLSMDYKSHLIRAN